MNQADDFQTPEGNVDSNTASFGHSWELSQQCPSALTTNRHPCDIQTQKANIATKKCNKLNMAPFSDCHKVVDPKSFVDACRYDVCGCRDGIECLCNAISSYTKECADAGVVIDWRNSNIYPECGKIFYKLMLLVFIWFIRGTRAAPVGRNYRVDF